MEWFIYYLATRYSIDIEKNDSYFIRNKKRVLLMKLCNDEKCFLDYKLRKVFTKLDEKEYD